jgi:hypothetical protein
MKSGMTNSPQKVKWKCNPNPSLFPFSQIKTGSLLSNQKDCGVQWSCGALKKVSACKSFTN